MKRVTWVLAIFVLFFIIGCGTSSDGPRSSGSDSSPNVSDDQQDTGGFGVSDSPVNIRIPSNETAPDGVLEQLSWAGTGGPGGLWGEQVCGNCSVRIDDKEIVLSGFRPSQKLEALVYRYKGPNDCADGTAEYVTTLYIEVDATGSFSSSLSGSTDDLDVVSIFDRSSGQQIWRNYIVRYGQLDCSVVLVGNSCPGAPPQRLDVNEMAYICTSTDTVKLREGPGKGYSVIKSLVPGADVKITGGPKCGDNWSWWQVETESGYVGWMSEGGDNVDEYFLCPAP